LKQVTYFYSFFIFALAVCLGPVQIQAADFFIDARIGSDSNPGSKNAPWQTIAKANSSLQRGDTVYIRAGNYEETIRPVNSGRQGNYITYTAYNGESVTIGGNITYGADLSDRSFIKIDGLQFTDTLKYWIQFWSDGSYNIVQNCTFEATGSSMGWAGLMIGERADYNQIINNSFSSVCKPDDLVDIYSASNNLIEDNYFGNAAHTALSVQVKGLPAEFNIIRNNTFQNGFHTNLAVYMGPIFTLVEGNLVYDAGGLCDDDGCPQNRCGTDRDRSAIRSTHSGIQVAADYSIIRNNVLVNNGRFAMESWDTNRRAIGNHVYSNTFSGNYHGWSTESGSDYGFSDNIVVNNIFSNNIEYNMKFSYAVTDATNRFLKNRFHGNATVRYKYRTDVDNIQEQYSREWSQNELLMNDVPGFIDVEKRDFKLRGDSVLIDKGNFLTQITSPSGSGSAFNVEDSRYFSDGFGVIQGDKLQIEGQSTVVKIKSINYSTHQIVLDRTVSWNKGDGISLPYSGNAPDIGAFEYNSLVPPKLFIVQQ
jgi:hypothetical protein